MEILKIGSQVEQHPLEVCLYNRSKVMVLIIEYKALYQSIAKSSKIRACRVSGKGQTYNDLYWM